MRSVRISEALSILLEIFGASFDNVVVDEVVVEDVFVKFLLSAFNFLFGLFWNLLSCCFLLSPALLKLLLLVLEIFSFVNFFS